MVEETKVSTPDTKRHFTDVYHSENPVMYKDEFLVGLEYVSDTGNRQTFDRYILPFA